MSLFQCEKCGVIENTATSDGGYLFRYLTRDVPQGILDSYRNVLELKPGEPFGKYCCVCNPAWIRPCDCGEKPHRADCASCEYAAGRPPAPKQWHGRFPQRFYPLGTAHTNREGNIEVPTL